MTPQNAAVVGHPIGHTMSPFIQERLFALSGIPVRYRVIDVPDLAKAFPQLLRELDCFNVTIPYKSELLDYVHTSSLWARTCGSANTVKVDHDGPEGDFSYADTTDGPGAALSLSHHGLDLNRELVILGHGGAAKAIAFEAAKRPGFRLTFVHREGSGHNAMYQAGMLADCARGQGDKDFRVKVMSYQELEADLGGRYELLVNATSVGMHPHPDACPVSEQVIARSQAVFDVVYNPRETLLLKRARQLGVQAVGGMGMLVCQAAYSHKIWYGTEFNPQDLLQLIEDAGAELARKFG